MRPRLLRIVAPHFVAGCLVDATSGIVIEAAPILARCRAKTGREVRAWAASKGYEAAYMDG